MKSSVRSRQRAKHAPTIMLLALIGVLALVLQARYVSNQAKKEYRIARTCTQCGGHGLELGKNMKPLFKEGAIPHMHHLLYHLERGRSLSELACSQCFGVGKEYLQETMMSLRAESIMYELEKMLGSVRSDLPDLRISCPVCYGTGAYGVAPPLKPGNDDRCQACFGNGYRYVRLRRASPVLCIPCEGMGRIVDPQTGEGRTCGRCSGFGTLDRD